MNKVRFSIGEEYHYNRCRACGKLMLWFAILKGTSDTGDIEELTTIMLQAPIEENRVYCPCCGKQEMWREDE